MRIARFVYKNKIYWGELGDSSVTLLKDQPYKKIKLTNQKISLNKVKLLPPACPSKIIMVGLNYRDHAKELNMPIPAEPIIFLKPDTTLIGHGQVIIYPQGVKRLDYEAELAVVIKRKGKFISFKNASRYILGYTCLNDVTARDLQKKDVQWTRAKSFDSFCPLGPWLETDLNTKDLEIKLYLNGKLKQHSSTRNLIFSVEHLISFVSRIMTLFPGDVISTGTPRGVGRMKRRDKVEIEISGIGKLANPVA